MGMDMAKALREWRVERLMSIRSLADIAGVSTKTVVQLEAGRQLPTFRTMQRITTALRVDAAEIKEFAAALDERGKEAV